MDKNEAYIDQTLQMIIEADKQRQDLIHSTHLRYFHNFDPGVRVSMMLTSIAIDGIAEVESQRVEATLVDNKAALIKVHYTENGLDEWQDQTIGLAVRHRMGYPAPGSWRVDPCFVAGNRQVCYFEEKDLQRGSHGTLDVNRESIHQVMLKYGRLAVDGAVIFDFIDHQ